MAYMKSAPSSYYLHRLCKTSPFRTPYRVTFIYPPTGLVWRVIYYALQEEELNNVIKMAKFSIARNIIKEYINAETDIISAYAPLGALEITRINDDHIYANLEHKLWQLGEGTHMHEEHRYHPTMTSPYKGMNLRLSAEWMMCSKCTNL